METSTSSVGILAPPVQIDARMRVGLAAGTESKPGWEEPDCLLCGGRRRKIVVRAYDNAAPDDWHRYAVVECLDCGLRFTSPRPSPELIGKFYPDWYEPHELPGRRHRLSWRSWLAARFGWSRHARKALPWHGQGRLLDFGCGGGSYLQRMHRLGWQVTGIDVCPIAVERIRRHLGLLALAGSLPHPELTTGSFDVVTMWHSLEHVHDPLAVLRETRRLLAPGGRLLVAAPNIDSLPFRWFGSAWYGLDVPRHLIHFNPATLAAVVRRAGFRAIELRMVRRSGWLRESAQIALQNKALPAWQRCLRGKAASRLVTAYCALVRQSDCMLLTAER